MIRDYIIGDIYKIDVQEQQLEDADDITAYERNLSNLHICKTGILNDKIHFICGANINSGKSTCWIILAKGANLRFAYKYLLKSINKTMKEERLRRVELVTRENFKEATRFAEMLKFNKEGVLMNYFKNGNGVLYARYT